MKRRDFVKNIVIATVATTTSYGQQSASTPPQATQQGAQPVSPGSRTTAPAPTAARRLADFKTPSIPSSVPDVAASTDAHFLTQPQRDALQKLCVLFVPPRSGYPGALEAGTPEFLEFVIGASPIDRQRLYQGGLDRLNEEAAKRFHVAFMRVDAVQAKAILSPALQTWMLDHPPADPFKRFIAMAHHDIRTATTNSQVWSMAAVAAGERVPDVGLYWSPIDPIV